MEPSFHICSTILHARQHSPSHLPPSEPSRAELCIIGSFPNRQLTTTCIMTSTRYCDFHYFGDKGADHCGKGDNRHPDRDKEPLETIEGATRGKVYLKR